MSIPWNVRWSLLCGRFSEYPLSLGERIGGAFNTQSTTVPSELMSILNSKGLFTGPCAQENLRILLVVLSAYDSVPLTRDIVGNVRTYFGANIVAEYNSLVEQKIVSNSSASVNVHIHSAPIPISVPAITTTEKKGKPVIVPGANKSKLKHPSTAIDTDMCFVFVIPSLENYADGTTFDAKITIKHTFKGAKKEANETFNSDLKALKDVEPKATPIDVPHGYMVAGYGQWYGAAPPEEEDHSFALPSRAAKKKEED